MLLSDCVTAVNKRWLFRGLTWCWTINSVAQEEDRSAHKARCSDESVCLKMISLREEESLFKLRRENQGTSFILWTLISTSSVFLPCDPSALIQGPLFQQEKHFFLFCTQRESSRFPTLTHVQQIIRYAPYEHEIQTGLSVCYTSKMVESVISTLFHVKFFSVKIIDKSKFWLNLILFHM